MSRVTASLVVYRSSPGELESVFHALESDPTLVAWNIVDNAASEDIEKGLVLKMAVERRGGGYISTSCNLGFGGGHNLAIAALSGTKSEFHLLLNPDISFGVDVLPELSRVMDVHQEVGLLMPRVLYPDGAEQALCKLLPTPLDLAIRRFVPARWQHLVRRRMDRYEMRSMSRDIPAEVPFLSGCFMFLRRSLLEAVGGFDETYFLYMEDLDLCRRLAIRSKLMYWPAVSVVHVHARGSHKQFKLMLLHLRSAITYFNTWGWFFDSRRREINRAAVTSERQTEDLTTHVPSQ